MYYVCALMFENGSFKTISVKFEKIESALDFVKNNIKSKDTWLHYSIFEKGYEKK